MHTWNRCRLAAAVLTSMLGCFLALTGCGGGGDESEIARLVASFSGAQETPAAVNTPATGTGVVTLFGVTPTTNEQMNIQTNTTGLTNVTAAHLHVRSGMNPSGPAILTMFPYIINPQPYNGTLGQSFFPSSPEFVPNAGVGVNTWQDLVAAVLEGRSYINFHTSDGVPPTNTGAGDMATGEIRGIVAIEDFRAALNGDNERPTPVITTGIGNATVGFNFDRTHIDVVVTFANLAPANVTMAHIHEGGPNSTGGPIFTIFDRATHGALSSPEFARNLTSAEFTASGPVTTFQQALNAIRAGNAYVNVHTDAFPLGEIRGQLSSIP